jgi:hypothetical protein
MHNCYIVKKNNKNDFQVRFVEVDEWAIKSYIMWLKKIDIRMWFILLSVKMKQTIVHTIYTKWVIKKKKM